MERILYNNMFCKELRFFFFFQKDDFEREVYFIFRFKIILRKLGNVLFVEEMRLSQSLKDQLDVFKDRMEKIEEIRVFYVEGECRFKLQYFQEKIVLFSWSRV